MWVVKVWSNRHATAKSFDRTHRASFPQNWHRLQLARRAPPQSRQCPHHLPLYRQPWQCCSNTRQQRASSPWQRIQHQTQTVCSNNHLAKMTGSVLALPRVDSQWRRVRAPASRVALSVWAAPKRGSIGLVRAASTSAISLFQAEIDMFWSARYAQGWGIQTRAHKKTNPHQHIHEHTHPHTHTHTRAHTHTCL